MPENLSAERFAKELDTYRSTEEREKYQRYFKTGEGQYGDVFIGMHLGQIFARQRVHRHAARRDREMARKQGHEIRVGALSIMGKQGRSDKTPEGRRKELFDLYLRCVHNLSAPYVVGRCLFDKPREAASTGVCGGKR